ncbi:MAG: hypothetical protein FJ146_10375 [Deltaproteobacteria bacterium]|nr:hypothetical protein [Deltaproteobacteria bacterium]
MNRPLLTLCAAVAALTLPLKGLATTQTETFLQLDACRHFVRLSDTTLLVGRDDGLSVIDPSGHSSVLKIDHAVRDAVRVDDHIVALVDADIVRVDLATGAVTNRVATQAVKPSRELLAHEMPRALARHGDALLVAHGTLGVTILDPATLELRSMIAINAGEKVKNMAQDLVVSGDQVFALVDNYQINPVRPNLQFRGLLQLDSTEGQISGRFGGLDPGATAVAWHDDTLLVSFGGHPVWRLRTPLSAAVPLAKGSRLMTKLGSDRRIVGRFSLDDAHVWACQRSNQGAASVPVVFDRASLGL